MFEGCLALRNAYGISSMVSHMVRGVANIIGMFKNCTSLTSLFNANLTTLIQSNVKYGSHLFYSCTNLSDVTGIGSYTVDNLVSLAGMFFNCPVNTSISEASTWRVSNSVEFTVFANLAAQTASIPDTEHPDNMHKNISPSLRALDSWNVDPDRTNTSRVFGYEYSSTSAKIFPYVNVNDDETHWHREPAVSWYIDANNNDSGIITYGSTNEMLLATDLV
jgi:hypothetical protein